MKSKKKLFIKMSLYSLFVIAMFIMLLSTYETKSFTVYSSIGSKYLTKHELVVKAAEKPKGPLLVSSLAEVVKNAPNEPVIFSGTMTAYGPDCVGCGGILACSPRHDARNGNIYHHDKNYGKMRVIAGDRRIPCGTVIKVSGVRGSEPFLAIVLDRGGVIKETLFDLLFESSAVAKPFGRQKITYETVRWGW